jgi:hypothetical protein
MARYSLFIHFPFADYQFVGWLVLTVTRSKQTDCYNNKKCFFHNMNVFNSTLLFNFAAAKVIQKYGTDKKQVRFG